MGIEKLIPRRRDLGVFLRLLARSATGQPITTYTSHFHGPRPGGELHIVLVDNGRSDMLASDDSAARCHCIRCGACLNTCPVYRRSGGHSYGCTVPGPIGSILAPGRDAAKHSSCRMRLQPVRLLHRRLPGEDRPAPPVARLAERDRAPRPALARQAADEAAGPCCGAWLYRAAGWLLRRFVSRCRALIYNRFNPWGRQREMPPMPRHSFRQLHPKRK